jgi:hypothetical protein
MLTRKKRGCSFVNEETSKLNWGKSMRKLSFEFGGEGVLVDTRAVNILRKSN